MNSRTTRRFRELLDALPEQIRQQAIAAFRLFQTDASHPSLRSKQAHQPPPTYSIRMGLRYRALGVLPSFGFGLDIMPIMIVF